MKKPPRPWMPSGITRPSTGKWKLPEDELLVENHPEYLADVVKGLKDRGDSWTAQKLIEKYGT